MSDNKATNIVNNHHITRDQRSEQKQQKPCVLWVYRVERRGKSTVANALRVLPVRNRVSQLPCWMATTCVTVSNRDLYFTDADRVEKHSLHRRSLQTVCLSMLA